MYKPVFCTKTNGCLHLSDALGEEDMYVNVVGPTVKIRLHSSKVPPPHLFIESFSVGERGRCRGWVEPLPLCHLPRQNLR